MYIERESLIIHFSEMSRESIHDEFDAGLVHGYENALQYVEEMNPADVETVVRGQWIDEFSRKVRLNDANTGNTEDMFIIVATCSICNNCTERMLCIKTGIGYSRCPHCGAIMKGD